MTDKIITFDDLLTIGEDMYVSMQYATQTRYLSALTIILHTSTEFPSVMTPYDKQFSHERTSYRIDFETYIGMLVFQEEFIDSIYPGETEPYEGHYVRRYKKSSFYEQIDKIHQFDKNYKHKFVHYSFVCSRLGIDIISNTPPTVEKIIINEGIRLK